jgi:uncharacterized lipoprotein YddW (UPF0748 family)
MRTRTLRTPWRGRQRSPRHGRRSVLTLALVGALAAVPLTAAADSATDEPGAIGNDTGSDADNDVAATDADGPRAIAADGTTRAIDAIDPGNRTEGILALYTPEFGATTGTNEFGGEAVLVPSDDGADRFEVTHVCTVFGAMAGDCDQPGNNPIPEDGYVLSASPGGDDPRTFLRDHVEVGDVVTLELPVLREATTTLDATDPTAATNPEGVDTNGVCFPGCRGAEQLIRYTPAFGSSTGTNQFGYEVIVVDGRVVERGGNDNPIPEDGFVLSGHGSRGNWLATNAVIGARVEVDGDVLRVIVDVGAYLFGAERAIGEASTSYTSATDACLAIDGPTAQDELASAEQLLADARAAEDDGDEQQAVELAEAAEAAADRSWFATRTSRTLETRGIWVRPEEESPAAIADTVAELADAGFTTIYLESFFQGYTIFPSQTAADHGVEPQRPQFAHFDPLEVWIDEADAHGLELHPWVHTFFVGNDAVGGPGPILEVHPEWAAVERGDVGAEGPQPSTAEAGYYFVDPSIPEARDYLHGVFDELVSEYDVAGLHLDYIRYPISLPIDVSFSYSDHARAVFEDEHGTDPYELTEDDELWETWNAWRRAQVTSFVTERHQALRELDDRLVLSAAVFPDTFDAEERKFQGWAGWSHDGVIDLLTGMSFGGSPSQSAIDTEVMLDRTADDTLIVTGTYAPFDGLPPDTMIQQLEAVRGAGGHGVALFAYNQLTSRQATALALGPFRDPAVSVDVAPVASVVTGLQDLADRLEGVHAPCLDRGTRRAALQRLDRAVEGLARVEDGRGEEAAGLRAAERHLEALASWLGDRVGPEPLATQLDEELTRAAEVVHHARVR